MAGILGKPNSGKSTFFNAATLLNVPMANYPFTTINPNLGVGYIRVPCVCKELGVEDSPVNSKCIQKNRLIPVRLVDVAGLVPGASRGRGLGNKFLDDIRQADALIHVIDASGSTDEEGRQISTGERDPIEDIRFVENEFDLWLHNIVEKDWQKTARTVESGSTKLAFMLAQRLSGLSVNEAQITETIAKLGLKAEKPISWSEEDLKAFSESLRATSKPSVIAANKADLPSSVEKIEHLRRNGYTVIPCAAEAELLLRRAAEAGLIEYLPGDEFFHLRKNAKLTPQQSNALRIVEEKVLAKWGSTGVQKCLNEVYLTRLGGVVVYPVEDEKKFSNKNGNILPDAYIMRTGATVKDLAFAVHTDLGNTFLYAIDAKTGLKLGADHKLKNHDVVKIVASAKRA